MIEAEETDLTGRVWPVHLKPQQDELLSSWLTRLALAHGQTAASFFTQTWPGRYLLCRDLDLWNDQTSFELARKTNTPPARALAATLASYDGWLFEGRQHQSHAPWVLARHLNVRPQNWFGLQFCPWCLAADKEPYFRRQWRLALMVLCPIHRVLLLDQCQSCGAAVCYERQSAKELGDAEGWTLTRCHKCNADLRDSATERNGARVDNTELEFQILLATTLSRGWIEMPQNGVIYSHLFFSGLHQMMSKLIYGRRASSLKAALWQNYAIDLPIEFVPDKSVSLERLNVAQRLALLRAVWRLLQDWPDNFIEFCRANKLASHFLIGDTKRLPFWYWRVVREHLTKSARRVSDQEIISIVNYAHKQSGQEPAPELNQFLSHHIMKRARRAGLFAAKKKQYPGLCRYCQATQRQKTTRHHSTVLWKLPDERQPGCFWCTVGPIRVLMADTPMAQQSKTLAFVFCGRSFLATEIELIRDVVSDFRCLSLTELARTICELLDWKRPNGRLKNHECRLLLEKLSDAGLVRLPALRESGPRGPRVVVPTENGAEQEPVTGSAGELAPLTLTVVGTGPESALWNEFVARYHYLGYRVPVGANLRYLVRSGSAKQVLACLLWSSPAWKMAARDSWIGWTDEERARKLQLIVNNSRFLILPWVRVRYLASTILSLCARQLPADWERLYGYRPLLLETLVDAQFRGTSYQAANWTYLGETRGRGRMDQHHEAHGCAVKQIYVYPLWRAKDSTDSRKTPRRAGSWGEA